MAGVQHITHTFPHSLILVCYLLSLTVHISQHTSHFISLSFSSTEVRWSIMRYCPHFIHPIIQSTDHLMTTMLTRFERFHNFHNFHTPNNTQSNGKDSRKMYGGGARYRSSSELSQIHLSISVTNSSFQCHWITIHDP